MRPTALQIMSQEKSSTPSCSLKIGVGLHAERIDAELERAALVVERVDHDPDVIVLDERVGVVAVHEVGADVGRRRVVRAEGDVEVRRVVGDEALGLDRRRHVVAGRPLVRQRHDGGRLPGVLVEHAVDLDRGRRAGDGERELGERSGTPVLEGPGRTPERRTGPIAATAASAARRLTDGAGLDAQRPAGDMRPPRRLDGRGTGAVRRPLSPPASRLVSLAPCPLSLY